MSVEALVNRAKPLGAALARRVSLMARSHLARHRLVSAILCLSVAWYAPWLVTHANWHEAWLATPFVLANALVIVNVVVSAINSWQQSTPPLAPVVAGQEPPVAVIVPTSGEPLEMVMRTARSVLEQRWPREKLYLVISDDAHSPRMREAVRRLQRNYPGADIAYLQPPTRGTTMRQGDQYGARALSHRWRHHALISSLPSCLTIHLHPLTL